MAAVRLPLSSQLPGRPKIDLTPVGGSPGRRSGLGAQLFLRLHPSRSAAAALILIHGLAVAAIAVSQFALAARILLLVLLAFSMARELWLHALRLGPGAVVALSLRGEGELELEYGDGRRIATRVDPSSTVWHWLMALRLRQERRSRSLFLLPDMLDDESWRRLSVQLRVGKLKG
ncbi:protein YgfX [Georgfuchsia toluolica]|uniref:protein YgfX n=1 Tax=Georgfuchsia toluolica TaxID=424218 RepID=UPI0031B84F5F